MEYLPETIGNCLYLEILDMSGCKLKELPEQFGYLFRLIEVDIGVNKVKLASRSMDVTANQMCSPRSWSICRKRLAASPDSKS